MLSRRSFLKSLIIAGSAIAFSSCKKMEQSQENQVRSNVADIKPKLDRMLDVLKNKRPDIEKDFLPGLSRDDMRRITNGLPFPFPPELEQLYMWRNGTRNTWMDSAEPLFIFRDHSFLPLEKAIRERDNIVKYYSIRDVFPFAGNNGFYLALSGNTFPHGKRFERPVIQIGEGVTIFFFSLSSMLDTVTEWIEKDVYKPYDYGGVDTELERKIWESHNPGWLKESNIL